jgi:hypothetical protein
MVASFPLSRNGVWQPLTNRRHRFWGPNRWETVQVVLRPNHSQTVNLGFKAQPRNPRSSPPPAPCRPHTAPPDLSTTQPPSTWPVRPSPVLCTRSHTPAAVLIAARHTAPATCTPRDKQTRFSKWKKDKRKTKQSIPDLNSNLAKSMTYHNQTMDLTTWFLKNFPVFPCRCVRDGLGSRGIHLTTSLSIELEVNLTWTLLMWPPWHRR